MSRLLPVLALAVIPVALAGPSQAPPAGPSLVQREQRERNFSLDDNGFIRNWLALPPIVLGGYSGSHSEAAQKPYFDREFFKGQKSAMPMEGDKAAVGGKELVWKAVQTAGPTWEIGSVERAISFGIAYLMATQAVTGVVLSIGSDDSSLWNLNGVEVIRIYEGRGVQPDQNKSKPLTLKKGLNVLSVAVINGTGGFGACARFLKADGKPVRHLVVASSPRQLPSVKDGGVSAVTADGATVRVELVSTGNAETSLFVYSGPRDGGTNRNNWAAAGRLSGPRESGEYMVRIRHGSSNTIWRYRACATNEFGAAWSDASGSFITGLVEVRVTARESTEEKPASFVISRPLTATNAALAVNMAFSGGINGVDFDMLDNPATIPAGAAEVSLPLIPSSGWRGDTRPKLITLEIAPGGYMTGAKKSAAIMSRPTE